jgi:HNH endonuclease
MEQALVSLVWDRANRTCEYCQLPQSFSSIPFEVDHIIARKHGGPSEAANLALSCFYCNSYKGPNIAGFHPGSGRVLRLYHPRKDRWERHFRWTGPVLAPRTTIGQVTLAVLSINHPDAVVVRQALLEEGVFPPPRRPKR